MAFSITSPVYAQLCLLSTLLPFSADIYTILFTCLIGHLQLYKLALQVESYIATAIAADLFNCFNTRTVARYYTTVKHKLKLCTVQMRQ
jgi:hypothetical protein